MSFNLALHYIDHNGLSVKAVELQQTPTHVTEQILALKSHNDRLHAYLDYIEFQMDESESELKQRRVQIVKEGMELYDFTYKQACRTLALMPDRFIPESLREYRRLFEIDRLYGEDYECEFYGR